MNGQRKATVIGILAIIAIAVAIPFIIKGAKPRKKFSAKPVFLCANCGHHFEVDPYSVRERIRENPNPDGSIKCPGCGQFAAYPATKCLHCGQYYIAIFAEETEQGRICPHCGKTPGVLPK